MLKKLQHHSTVKFVFEEFSQLSTFPWFLASHVGSSFCFKYLYRNWKGIYSNIIKQANVNHWNMGRIHCLALIHFDCRFYKFTSFLLGFCFECFAWFINSWIPKQIREFRENGKFEYIPGGAFLYYLKYYLT